MAKILSPKPALEWFEQQIDIYKEYLNGQKPKLGVLIKEAPDEGASSYLRQIRRNAEKYGVELKVVETSQPINHLVDWKAENDLDGVMFLSDYHPCIKDMVEHCQDIDRMTTASLSMLYTVGGIEYAPITVEAVCRILEFNDIHFRGKRVGVIGRSLRVGRPLAEIVLQMGGTPTIYHSHSDLTFAQNDDIIVSAIGKPKFLKGDLFREGQVVVDVGINLDDDGKLCGDIDFSSAADVIGENGAITPVPGGVGTLTTAILFYRLFKNACGDGLCIR